MAPLCAANRPDPKGKPKRDHRDFPLGGCVSCRDDPALFIRGSSRHGLGGRSGAGMGFDQRSNRRKCHGGLRELVAGPTDRDLPRQTLVSRFGSGIGQCPEPFCADRGLVALAFVGSDHRGPDHPCRRCSGGKVQGLSAIGFRRQSGPLCDNRTILLNFAARW